jgi:hypothetical protein
MPRKNTSDGIAVAANMYRHAMCPFQDAAISASVALAGTGCAISQLVNCARKRPITMVNSFRQTSLPRISAGAASAMYMGERPDAMPIASPPRMRQNTKASKTCADPVPIDDTTNTDAAISRARLRPSASLSTPEHSAPAKQPISAQLIAQPDCVALAMPKYAS